MRGRRWWLLVLGSGLAAAAAAQDSETPDVGFLEYLGSWQEDDEEWLVVAGMGDELDGEREADENEEQDEDRAAADDDDEE